MLRLLLRLWKRQLNLESTKLRTGRLAPLTTMQLPRQMACSYRLCDGTVIVMNGERRSVGSSAPGAGNAGPLITPR